MVKFERRQKSDIFTDRCRLKHSPYYFITAQLKFRKLAPKYISVVSSLWEAIQLIKLISDSDTSGY